MKPEISLTQAMRDPKLLGGPFASPSFWTWKTVAKLIDGEELDEREAELVRTCTGRTVLPSGPVRRLILLAGRRAGKDRFLSAVAVWRAALCADWHEHISAGEQATVTLLGADRKQAAILRRYCWGLLAAPLLADEVLRQTDDIVEFRNGAALEVATNDARLVRGRSAVAVLGSECCHWRTDEAASSSDEEVVAAAEPSLSMCPDGGLLLLGSSVYRRRGYMFRKWKQLHGDDDAEAICWLAPSTTMNLKLRPAVVEAALAEDPERAKAEYLSIWRSDLSDFIPADVIEACTDFGVRERAPLPRHRYCGYVDAAGGTGSDAFALAIAHREDDGLVLLDVLRVRQPRFVPESVISEFAETLKMYRITSVQGDRWGGGFHSSAWQRRLITFEACERTTSENYLAGLPLLLSGQGRVLDDTLLRQQLGGLERRVTSGDREVVTHAPSRSAHDDAAAAAMGAMVLAAAASKYRYDTSGRWLRGFARLSQLERLAPPPPLSPEQQAEREKSDREWRWGEYWRANAPPSEW